jgi:WXG100 family type VII secretion target
MADFVAGLDSLAQACAATRSAAASLEAELAGLRGEVDAVLDGWRGVAASGFDRAWCEWLAGARGVQAGLDELAALVAGCAASYAAEDGSAAGALRLAAR